MRTTKILYVPFLMAVGGVGLTFSNALAVIEALIGKKSAFARTPKYRVKQKGEASQAKVYRKRLGFMPWLELAVGGYFAWTVYYAISTENYFTVPSPGAVRVQVLVYGFPEPAAGTIRARGGGARAGPGYTRSHIRWGFRVCTIW